MTEAEIQNILEKQHKFFQTGQTLPVNYRIEQLKKLKDSIIRHEPDLNLALKADLGKSETESYMCEVGLTLSELSWMLKHIKKLTKEKWVPTPLAQFAAKSFRSPSPYGTVLIMSPWNYPVLLTLEPLIDALAAGNTAVVKPSAYAPATSRVMQEIIEECFSEEYVAVVTGGRAENQALLNQRFDKIFFTGGKTVGREVLRHAAEYLTPVTLELGGKSPCIVDSTAKIPLAARRIVFGKYLNCGQTCVAPDYILCDNAIRDQLIDAIKSEIRRQFGKHPLENPSYGKIINRKHFQRLQGLIDSSKVIIGGQSDAKILRIAPTVMKNVTWDDAIMGEEIFGPILPILTYESLDEAIQTVESHPHPLALYFFSEDKAAQKKVLDRCHFGGGCINDTIIHLATSAMPFGGVGESGMGGYHGKAGFDEFTHYRSIVDKKTWMDLPVRYQRYTKFKRKKMSILEQREKLAELLRKQHEDKILIEKNEGLIADLEKRLHVSSIAYDEKEKELITLRKQRLEIENQNLLFAKTENKLLVERFVVSDIYYRFHIKEEWRPRDCDWAELFDALDKTYNNFTHRLMGLVSKLTPI